MTQTQTKYTTGTELGKIIFIMCTLSVSSHPRSAAFIMSTNMLDMTRRQQ